MKSTPRALSPEVTPVVTRNQVDVRYNMNITFNQFANNLSAEKNSNDPSTHTQPLLAGSLPTTKRAISVINQEAISQQNKIDSSQGTKAKGPQESSKLHSLNSLNKVIKGSHDHSRQDVLQESRVSRVSAEESSVLQVQPWNNQSRFEMDPKKQQEMFQPFKTGQTEQQPQYMSFEENDLSMNSPHLKDLEKSIHHRHRYVSPLCLHPLQTVFDESESPGRPTPGEPASHSKAMSIADDKNQTLLLSKVANPPSLMKQPLKFQITDLNSQNQIASHKRLSRLQPIAQQQSKGIKVAHKQAPSPMLEFLHGDFIEQHGNVHKASAGGGVHNLGRSRASLSPMQYPQNQKKVSPSQFASQAKTNSQVAIKKKNKLSPLRKRRAGNNSEFGMKQKFSGSDQEITETVLLFKAIKEKATDDSDPLAVHQRKLLKAQLDRRSKEFSIALNPQEHHKIVGKQVSLETSSIASSQKAPHQSHQVIKSSNPWGLVPHTLQLKKKKFSPSGKPVPSTKETLVRNTISSQERMRENSQERVLKQAESVARLSATKEKEKEKHLMHGIQKLQEKLENFYQEADVKGIFDKSVQSIDSSKQSFVPETQPSKRRSVYQQVHRLESSKMFSQDIDHPSFGGKDSSIPQTIDSAQRKDLAMKIYEDASFIRRSMQDKSLKESIQSKSTNAHLRFQQSPELSQLSEKRHNISNQLITQIKMSQNPRRIRELMSSSKDGPKIFNTKQLLVNCYDKIKIPSKKSRPANRAPNKMRTNQSSKRDALQFRRNTVAEETELTMVKGEQGINPLEEKSFFERSQIVPGQKSQFQPALKKFSTQMGSKFDPMGFDADPVGQDSLLSKVEGDQNSFHQRPAESPMYAPYIDLHPQFQPDFGKVAETTKGRKQSKIESNPSLMARQKSEKKYTSLSSGGERINIIAPKSVVFQKSSIPPTHLDSSAFEAGGNSSSEELQGLYSSGNTGNITGKNSNIEVLTRLSNLQEDSFIGPYGEQVSKRGGLQDLNNELGLDLEFSTKNISQILNASDPASNLIRPSQRKKAKSFFKSKYKKRIDPSFTQQLIESKDTSDWSVSQKFVHDMKEHHLKEVKYSKFYDLAEIKNIAFKRMNLQSPQSSSSRRTRNQLRQPHLQNEMLSHHTNTAQPPTAMSSAKRMSEQVNSELQISKFPSVSDVPMELYPFAKKVRIVSLAQRRNQKKFNHDKITFDKRPFYHHFRKEYQEKLRHDSGLSGPNDISEQKVRFWSHLLQQQPEK